MRVTCDACGAKYAIADERVQGRSVRVKCKKCGGSIAVGATPPAGGAAAAEPSWTVLLDDGEQRPVTAEQLAELYRDGAVHDETYLWKDGMGDWLPLNELDEAKRMALGQPEPGLEVTAVPVADGPAGVAAAGAVERARRSVISSPNVDLFGEGVAPFAKAPTPSPGRVEAAGVEAAPLSARSGPPRSQRSGVEGTPLSARSAPRSSRQGPESGPFSSPGGPLSPSPSSRGGAPRSGGDSFFGPPSSGPGSRRGAEAALSSRGAPTSSGRGAGVDDRVNATLSGSRNDDSVLFSVATLGGSARAGASAAPADFGPPIVTPSPGVITSESEASGMIDMRILSTMHGGPPKKEEPRQDRVDDLMNMGGGPSGGLSGGLSGPLFGPSLASPLLAPPPLEAPPAPSPTLSSAAEVPPASEGTVRDAEAPAVAAAASLAGARPTKMPRWAPWAAAGALGLVVLGALGVSALGPSEAEKKTPVAMAPKGGEVAQRGPREAPPEAEAPRAAEPPAAPPPAAAPTEGATARAEEGATRAEVEAPGRPEAAPPTRAEARKRDEETVKRRREREETERKEADQRRAEQEKKAAATAAAKTEAASAAAAAAAPAGTGSFDRGAASAALSSAAGGVGGCKKADGPTGSGRVSVTFAPSGSVTNAVVEGPPFAGTAVGGCVAAKFRGARVPAFAGAPITVKKSFSLN